MFNWLKRLWNPPIQSDKNEVLVKYLIAGLGNIGQEYKDTRHNVGFKIVDAIAEKKELDYQSGKHVMMTNFRFKGRAVHLIKPTTYMNLSGKAVRYWMQQLKIPKENLLVLVDDLDLPFGTLRLKKKGNPGGHNGLKDIDEMLGHKQYSRLRFGIGDDFKRGKQVDFVLGKWDKDEEEKLDELIDEAVKVVFDYVAIGPDRAMNANNKKKK